MPKPTNSRRSESFKEVVRRDLFKMMPTNLLTLQNSRTSPSIISFRSKPGSFSEMTNWKNMFEEKVENHMDLILSGLWHAHPCPDFASNCGCIVDDFGRSALWQGAPGHWAGGRADSACVSWCFHGASHKSWGGCRRRRRSSSYRR